MRHRSALGGLLLLLVLGLGAAVLPGSVVACSCVGPSHILAMAGDDPQTAIFTGEAGPAAGGNQPVRVTSWFRGPGAAEVVSLDIGSMANTSCGSGPLQAGLVYLFVNQRDAMGRFVHHLCSVAADVATPDGRALLDQAVATYGPPAVPEPPPPADAGPPVIPIAVGALFAVGVIGGVLLVVRRRGEDDVPA